jgi:hypothetical protein
MGVPRRQLVQLLPDRRAVLVGHRLSHLDALVGVCC